MADREVVGIELVAKLDQLRAEFKSLPKTTDQETKAAVGLALKNLNKLQAGAAKAAKGAKDALKPASDGVKEFADTAGDTDSALKALAGAIGLVSPAAAAAISGMGDLAGGAEGAAKASKLLGGGLSGLLIAGGVAIAVAGVGLAAYAAVSGVVSLVDGAGDLARSLNEVEKKGGATSTIGVPESTIKSFNEASASLDAIGLLVDQFKVSVADELTPAVQGSAKAILVMGLVARDVFDSYAQGEGIFRSLARFSVEVLVGALMGPVEALAFMAQGMGELAKIAGLESVGNTLIGVSEGWFDLKTTIADTVIDAAVWTTAEAVDGLSTAFSGYIDEANAIIGVTEEYNRKTRDAAEIAKGQAEEERRKAKALSDAKAVQDALIVAVGATSSASLALRQEEEETIAKMVEHSATEEQIAQAREAYAARRVALTEETVKEILALEQGSNTSVMGAVSAYTADRLSEEEKLEKELLQVKQQIVADAEKAQADLDAIISTASAGGDLDAVRAAENAKIQIGKQTQDALTAATEEGARRRTELATTEARAQSEIIGEAVSQTIGDIGAAFAAYAGLVKDNYQTTLDEIASLSEVELDAENKRREEAGLEAIKMDELVQSSQVKALEEKAATQKKIIIALFAAEQTAALAQIAIDTALGFSAVTAAYAATPPLMLGLQALVVASGIAQAAAVSAARPFHVGGIVRNEGNATGEVPARLLPGEVVINRQAVQGMGGPDATNSLNRGGAFGGMGGMITLNQVWRGSSMDKVVYDISRLPGSKTRQLTSGGRVGKRTR